MDSQRTERRLRFLELYALLATTVLVVLSLSAFRQQEQRTKFTEIDVERINVVEPDGKHRLVIANRERSIGPIYKGQPFGYPGGTRPGLIFFNDEGTENGGLTFQGRRQPDGTFTASSGFSFDQFDQDQVLYLQYTDNNGRRRMGLTIADRADRNIFELVKQRDSINALPDSASRVAGLQALMAPRNGVPLFAQRVYVGRDVNKTSVVNLSDAAGKSRLRLTVDSLGTAAIEFLDADGNVTRRIGAR